jgi:glycosyltransferase involved in cell wall biosynthesis
MERLRAYSVPVSIVPSIAHARSNATLRRPLADVHAVLNELQPQIVHGHSSHAGLLARLAARRLHLPSVYTAHGWPFQRGASLVQRATSYVGEFAGGHIGDAVICLTEAERARALRSHVVRADRLWVVPNGLSDVAPSRVRHAGDERGAGIVMVARFAPPKLQAELISVMSTLLDLPWRLTFVGDGPELARCSEVGRRLLGDRVLFLGHRDDVEVLLADNDIAVLWSAYEGLPISLLEAMRAGLCCVGSDLPGVRTLLGRFASDPEVGLVAVSPEELAVKLRTVIGDRSARRELGVLARQRYERTYSAAAMEERTRSVYTAVLARRAASVARARVRWPRR